MPPLSVVKSTNRESILFSVVNDVKLTLLINVLAGRAICLRRADRSLKPVNTLSTLPSRAIPR